MILLIDNYDSFSYNLFQLVGSIEPDIRIVRNDGATVADIAALSPEKIILSPGPGRPADAGVCSKAVKTLGGKIPILGVCLGHQSLAQAFIAHLSGSYSGVMGLPLHETAGLLRGVARERAA